MTSRSSLLISSRVCTLSRVYFIKTHLTQKKKHGTPKKAYFWIIRKIGNILSLKHYINFRINCRIFALAFNIKIKKS